MKSNVSLFLMLLSSMTFSSLASPLDSESKQSPPPLLQHPSPMPATNSDQTLNSTNSIPSDKEAMISGKPQVFTFPDGMTLIVEEDHNAPVASVQAWCSTGSIHEGELMGAGLSHILEHMLFKGTTSRGPGIIAKEVQNQGGYINAYTSFDRTVFWIDLPAAGVSEAVDILADAMMNATLPENEYTKEQEVIRREFAMGYDDPDRMSNELLFRTAYHKSPFRHPVIGYLDVYNQLTREDVLDYYKKRYVPNNIFFVVVGDVDAKKIHQQLADFFAKYPRQVLAPVFVEKEPPQLGVNVARDFFPTELSRLNIAWKAPGVTSSDAPALEVLGSILGSGSSSILNQEVHEKKELVHQVGAGLYPLSSQEGLFYVGGLADPEKTEAAEAEILSQVDLVSKNGVTAEELEKAKKGILSDHLNTLTTMRGRASDYGSSWLETGNPNFGKEYLAAINRVTLDDIKRVAAHYLIHDGLTITSLDPTPTQKKEELSSEQKIAQREVKKFVLPNGLRLLVCEDHRLPLISMTATFRGGLLAEDPQNNGLTDLLASTITKGTKDKTAEQIVQTIEQVGGSIGASAGSNSFSVAVEVMKPDFSLGLNLLDEVLTGATFPNTEVDREKLSQIAALKAEDDHMLTAAQILLKAKLFGSHPYSMRLLGTPKTVPTLTPEMLQEFSKKMIVGNNGVLAIFGDLKTEDVVSMATKAFANMPAGELALQTPPKPLPLTTALDEKAAEQKQQAIVMKGFLTASITSPDRPALELIDSACSDLGSRFFNRIREKQALAYFVGASSSMGLAPGAFIFYLGTDPQKVDHARSEFDDEISKVAKTGLTQEELDRAKKKVLGADAIAIQSNAGLAARCASEELMGLGFDHYLHRSDEINKVTLDTIREISQKYFNVPGSVEVIVAPPATKAVPSS